MSTPRDPDFDWRIRLRGMTEDEVAEVIERAEAALAARDCGHDRADSMVQKEFARLRRELAEARGLADKLADYVSHSYDCALDLDRYKLPKDQKSPPCSCGLDALMATLAARPAPAECNGNCEPHAPGIHKMTCRAVAYLHEPPTGPKPPPPRAEPRAAPAAHDESCCMPGTAPDYTVPHPECPGRAGPRPGPLLELADEERLRQAEALLERWTQWMAKGAVDDVPYDDTERFLAARPAPAECGCRGSYLMDTSGQHLRGCPRADPRPAPACDHEWTIADSVIWQCRKCHVTSNTRPPLSTGNGPFPVSAIYGAAKACDCIPENAQLKWGHIPECASGLGRADPRPEDSTGSPVRKYAPACEHEQNDPTLTCSRCGHPEPCCEGERLNRLYPNPNRGPIRHALDCKGGA